MSDVIQAVVATWQHIFDSNNELEFSMSSTPGLANQMRYMAGRTINVRPYPHEGSKWYEQVDGEGYYWHSDWLEFPNQQIVKEFKPVDKLVI